MGIGVWELGLILVIVLLLFGTRRLSSVGADLGAAIRGFRNAMREEKETPPSSSAPASTSGDGPEKRAD